MNSAGDVQTVTSLVFKTQNYYFLNMTIEQKKISLINWITTLEDETVINQIEGFRKTSLNQLPREIIELLTMSAAEKEEDCIEHTNVQDILDVKEE